MAEETSTTAPPQGTAATATAAPAAATAGTAPAAVTAGTAPAAVTAGTAPATATTGTAPAADTAAALQPGSHWAHVGMPEEDNDTDADSTLGSDGLSSTASLSSSILEYRTVNGRTYHSDRGDLQYWGPNDEQQSEGMDIQHHVWALALGGKLHLAPISDKIETAVDIGTGTGIWAIDFGDEYPNCKVIGTDLSPIQPTWTPPNVSFQIDDFTQEWTFKDNSLDYIHTRWLTGAVPDWNVFMKQAYRALKPGGWVEVLECDGAFFSDDNTAHEKTALGQWFYIFSEGLKKLGSVASFKSVTDRLFVKGMEEAGFVEINEKPLKIPLGSWPKDPKLKELGMYQQATMEADIEGFITFPATALGWSKEEIVVYAAHARKEMRSGKVHSRLNCSVAWAQKPE